jgi:hypothetical protein
MGERPFQPVESQQSHAILVQPGRGAPDLPTARYAYSLQPFLRPPQGRAAKMATHPRLSKQGGAARR